jgi:hypothetical protein
MTRATQQFVIDILRKTLLSRYDFMNARLRSTENLQREFVQLLSYKLHLIDSESQALELDRSKESSKFVLGNLRKVGTCFP